MKAVIITPVGQFESTPLNETEVKTILNLANYPDVKISLKIPVKNGVVILRNEILSNSIIQLSDEK